MQNNVYLYIFVMAGVTYLIRVLPLTLIKRELQNKTIRSFLYYVPYVTLAVMTFPAILESTDNLYAAWGGFIVALILAWRQKSLVQVAVSACVIVFLMEFFL